MTQRDEGWLGLLQEPFLRAGCPAQQLESSQLCGRGGAHTPAEGRCVHSSVLRDSWEVIQLECSMVARVSQRQLRALATSAVGYALVT